MPFLTFQLEQPVLLFLTSAQEQLDMDMFPTATISLLRSSPLHAATSLLLQVIAICESSDSHPPEALSTKNTLLCFAVLYSCASSKYSVLALPVSNSLLPFQVPTGKYSFYTCSCYRPCRVPLLSRAGLQGS